MKKSIIMITGIILLMTSISSCSRGYTCPTYSENETIELVKTNTQEKI